MLRKPEELTREQLQKLIEFLKTLKSEERICTFEKVLDQRTNYFTVLMENIDHPHNISAVLRSCDCFGVQNVNLVDDRAEYSVNRKVAMGSSKWLTLTKYTKHQNNKKKALEDLKSKGYRLVVTTPNPGAVSIQDVDISKGPVAFVFGTELTGVSPEASEMADEYLTIPMFGFTESLNLSVSVAIILQTVTSKLRNSSIHWELSDHEKELVMLNWLRKSTPRNEIIENRFFNQIENIDN
ncbi:TrmH family RNA methyltransferase [Natronoflexus pectinivorans]|uniref:tRNA (guanosine(18)-2'-O)-methyltransferase n=1 Tax=Natronoflexus pectinivorans TaxID=682526 RepID=A0A4R2GFE6_9BACT|nr:RNA methyltransferase [Natronoflexus pectinivorans]TCO06938.1 tRNA (guanosine-2'-O-)-methyltransferase [Natronoflexus pectinivorans]